jgi:hypothetical protein
LRIADLLLQSAIKYSAIRNPQSAIRNQIFRNPQRRALAEAEKTKEAKEFS